MNDLYDEEIRGHHSMRDHVLTVLSDADLDYKLPGANPSLAELLIELGTLQGVYTHSFQTFELNWAHREFPTPEPVTISTLRSSFDTQDDAMKTAMDRFTDDELRSTESTAGAASSSRRSFSTRSIAKRSTSSTER